MAYRDGAIFFATVDEMAVMTLWITIFRLAVIGSGGEEVMGRAIEIVAWRSSATT